MRRATTVFSLAVILSGICFLASPRTAYTEGTEGTEGDRIPAKNATFARDVAPIFYRSCTECHRPGEIAPFSMISYKEVRPWAKSIREKVLSREMPPWHADPDHGEWLNDRRLSQREIDTIVAWVDGGAKEGDPKDLPPAPTFVEGWQIGTPDETFSIPEQEVPAEGVVKYKYLRVPTNLKEDRWVTAAEIRSTGRAAVHHVIVFLQDASGTRQQDGNLLVGTAPGEQPAVYRAGLARKIPAGSILIFQMHYTPNGTATKDITTVGLKYAKEPPRHQLLTRPVLNMRFAIPPGAADHEVRSSYTFDEDVHLASLMPHMHLRGKDFEIDAILPDGTSKVLLRVPKYDFNWQTYYVPKDSIALPKGTKIECIAHFDNSPGNRFNPDPTRLVKWGEQTWEEMMIGWLSYYKDSDSSPAPTGKPLNAAASNNGLR